MNLAHLGLLLAFAMPAGAATPAPAGVETPPDRIASIAISEDFLNEQIRAHLKPGAPPDLKVRFDPEGDKIYFTGTAQVPVEELRAINLEPDLGKFRFQLSVRLRVSSHGHLILEFPLNETYFYPVGSAEPDQDRVIVPVQMLSIALASARGYLAALSGDFGGFERRAKKLAAAERALDHAIKTEKDKDVLDDLRTQREALRLQLAAIPIERKQLLSLSKEFASVLAFTGEKEINLNEELAAKRNSLVLKLKLSQLAPYLAGTELGSVRLRHDAKDGHGENYFIVDLNGDVERATAGQGRRGPAADRPPMKVAPSLVVRLHQALFETRRVLDAEKSAMSSGLREFNLSLRDDGLHVSGRWKAFLFFTFPFETIVDFHSTGPDVFEAKVREIQVAGLDFRFLSKFALESIQRRLEQSLKGVCQFQYLGEEKDHSRALRVKVDAQALVPAFPGLHLVDVDVRDQVFLLKVGHL